MRKCDSVFSISDIFQIFFQSIWCRKGCWFAALPDSARMFGETQTNSPHCIPVADDYMSMLRKAWKKPSQKPQFKIDCRRMAFFRVRMTVVKDPLYWSLYWGKRLRIFDKNEDLKVPFNAQHIGFY